MSIAEPDRVTEWRWQRTALYRWWRASVVGSVAHAEVKARIEEESGWSPRYAFMITMSAGIAVLGLLLSSPAVVIGAMLISPLMSPILGLGFALALFDLREARRALIALAIGAALAVAFTALVVLLSPLKAPTAEILARTRPNLFDLMVALFAALAGSFAIIRGKGETIVGVAIATALMPPLAVVGYGLATWNMPVLGGAFALFLTNFLTIALSAAVMARFYGFAHRLSSQQSWAQTIVLLLVFVAMAIPLGFSLSRIAAEAVTATQVRAFLSDRFGEKARVTQLDIDFDSDPMLVRSVVIAPRAAAIANAPLQKALAGRLGRPISLQVDQVLLDPGAGTIETQRAEIQRALTTSAVENAEAKRIASLVAIGAGIPPEDVTIDRDHHRATGRASVLPGATTATYRALEERLAASAEGWQIVLVPPLGDFPRIRFSGDTDTLDDAARDAVLLSAWEAKRWNVTALAVPGLPDGVPPARPSTAQRRALAIAALLRTQDVGVVAAPATGTSLVLSPARLP